MKTKILLADDEEDLEDLFRQLFDQQIQSNTYEFFFARDSIIRQRHRHRYSSG